MLIILRVPSLAFVSSLVPFHISVWGPVYDATVGSFTKSKKAHHESRKKKKKKIEK